MFSCVRPFATPWAVARQAPLTMEFSRQGYWSGLPFLFPGDLPDPGIEPASPALQADSTVEATAPNCLPQGLHHFTFPQQCTRVPPSLSPLQYSSWSPIGSGTSADWNSEAAQVPQAWPSGMHGFSQAGTESMCSWLNLELTNLRIRRASRIFFSCFSFLKKSLPSQRV